MNDNFDTPSNPPDQHGGGHSQHLALEPALKFLQQELVAVVERLSVFAGDLKAGVKPSKGVLRGAVVLGGKIGSLAKTLTCCRASDWNAAAPMFKGRHGKAGWYHTCIRIGRNPSLQSALLIVADRMEEAGRALVAFSEVEGHVDLAVRSRSAADALLQAAKIWNTAIESSAGLGIDAIYYDGSIRPPS